MMERMLPRLLAFLLLVSSAHAALVKVYVVDRSDVMGGADTGPAGPYERILARAHFAVDPSLPANRLIPDLDLAPRNAAGLVEFSADLHVLKPRDPARGNGTLLFDVVNRGGKTLLAMFHTGQRGGGADPLEAAHLGDQFLLRRGYTLVWLGWQADLEQGMRLEAPVARQGGQSVVGLVRAESVPPRVGIRAFPIAATGHRAYPVADPSDPRTQLTVRDTPEGPRRVIPRSAWQFARDEKGQPVADDGHVYVPAGMEAGRIYELVYAARDPRVMGLSHAAVRDLVSFLKHGGSATLLADQRRFLKRSIGFGVSQSGRFLRDFVYRGFNADEKGRPVFDLVWAHVAGAGRGSFAHRFAQPSHAGNSVKQFFYPVDLFPFADTPQTDPETGTSGHLLAKAEAAKVAPKMVYTNSSVEYWARAASLATTTLDGKEDLPLAAQSRMYFFAGTQHGPAPYPPPSAALAHAQNYGDYRWGMRALLVAVNEWLTNGTEPPASRYPTVARQELVPTERLRFPKLATASAPKAVPAVCRLDFGPEYESANIVSVQPPRVGRGYTLLVPQVDEDGNEVGGVRLPHVAVPLATYTGWNRPVPLVNERLGLAGLSGSAVPLARNRDAASDPRPSAEERYASREAFLAQVKRAAEALAGERFVLAEDVPAIVEQNGRYWDGVR